MILSRIMRHEVIGMETILGALCVYVLLGIAFAGIYAGINDFEPLGFFAQPGPKNNVDFLYFSFITQTTVGYGDLTPAHRRRASGRDVRGAHRPGVPRDARGPARDRCTATARPRRADDDDRATELTLALEHQLRELDRVERGALAQVVAGDPEVERALLRRVDAQTTHEHGIDPRGLERRGMAVATVDEAHTRRRFEQLDGLGARQLALELAR